MKTRTIFIQLALGFLATSSFAESPATLICDGFEGSSASDQARAFIQFSRSIDSSLSEIDPKDEACVMTKLDSLEETRSAYCESRANIGHDLAAGPLERLASDLFSVSSDCEKPRWEAETALLKEMLPDSCDELLSSFLAYVTYIESKPESDVSLIDCFRSAAPRHAPPLLQACVDGTLSLRAAYVELEARIQKTCDHAEGT